MRGKLFLLLFGAFIAFMGAAFCLILWKGYEKASITYGWTPVPATILSGWVEETELSDGRDRRYRLQVRYRYSWDGEMRVGTRVGPNDRPKRHRRKKDAQLEEFAPGTRVEAWVNPADPGQSVLQHDPRAPGYTIWFPALFVVGGLGMMIGALVRRSS